MSAAEPAAALDDFDAFMDVVAFALGTYRDRTITADTPLGDAGLDSMGLLLISVGLRRARCRAQRRRLGRAAHRR